MNHILHAELSRTDFKDVATGRRLPPSKPGDVLRIDFREAFGLSARALALAIGVPANRISAIVNGSRGITADTAIRLGAYFGTTAEFWMTLQSNHDLREASRAVKGLAKLTRAGAAMRGTISKALRRGLL